MVNVWSSSWRPLFYSRIGFSIYVAVYARHVKVPGGSKLQLAPGTIKRKLVMVENMMYLGGQHGLVNMKIMVTII